MESVHPRLCHSEGLTLVRYGSNRDGSSHHYFTAGSDNAIRIFDTFTDEDPAAVEHHTGAVLALAVRNNKLASASADHSVAIFDISKKEPVFESLATRFTLPVRCLSFNTTGSSLATAGDEPDIKIISLLDMSARVLRGHNGAIRSLSYDPEGDLLASASSDGTVRIWHIENETCQKSLSILPRGADNTLQIDWHPNGKFVAVPVRNQVIVYERDSWDELYTFSGDEGHSREVSLAVWSPNGEYLASVSINGEIIVWETQSRQTLGRFKHKDGLAIGSIAWHPKGNEISWADVHGKFSVWKEPVPEASQFSAPTGGDAVAEAAEASAQSLANMFADDDDDDVGATHKRLRSKKRTSKVDDSDDDDDGDNGIESSVTEDMKSAAAAARSRRDHGRGDDRDIDDDYRPGTYAPVSLQAPFQPASTPPEELRRILCWNNVGIINSREEETSCSVDIEFHNVQQHKPIRMIDHFGFTMGALSEHCFVMGGPSRTPNGDDERDNPSVLFCRNIDHWATDDTWQIFFPEGEEIECVAVGGGSTGYVAAATNKQYVRLYSTTGIPKHILCLDGPVVSMSAKDEQLFVVYHQATIPGNQCLGFLIFDIDARQMVKKDRLPLSPGADLAWLGFSDDGMVACVDTEEVVRAVVPEWGYTWTPLLEMKTVAKSETDNHWVVGITETEIMCVVCKGGTSYPKVLPKPMVTTLPLQMPLVSLKDTVRMEENFLRSKINFEHLVRVDELDERAPEDRKLMLQAQNRMDQHIIHCISRAVQTQRPGRALDLTTFLNLTKSIDVAIKLAVKAKSPNLADRMMIAKQANIEKKKQRMLSLRQQHSAYMTPQMTVMRAMHATPSQSIEKNSFGTDSVIAEGRLARKAIDRATPMQSGRRARAPDSDDEQSDTDMLHTSPRAAPTSTMRSTQRSTPATQSPRKPVAKPTNPFAKVGKPKEAPKAAAGSKPTPFQAALGSSPKKSTPDDRKRPAMAFLKQVSMTDNKKRKKDPNAPKKPMSSYFLWLTASRDQLKADFPELNNKTLLKKAGELWAAMGESEKKEWNTRAEEKKEEYLEACRAYEAKTSHQPTLTLSQPATTDSPTKETHDSTSEAPDVDAPMADVEPTEEAPADDGAAHIEETSADGAATESTPAGDETDAETQPMDTATEESTDSAHTD